jgi:hypothetical protein
MALPPDVCALLDAEVGSDISALQGALASLTAAAAAAAEAQSEGDEDDSCATAGRTGGGGGGMRDVAAVRDEILVTLQLVDQRHSSALQKVAKLDDSFGKVA